MKILISAAEASSDKQGAAVLRALQSEGEVQAFGMGGDHLIRAGLSAMVDAQDLMSMGFVEVVSRLPKINRALKILEEEAIRQKPDLALLIDYPDFHFQLAKRLKKLKIPIVNFIPPKTWAWRTGRVKDMKLLYDRVLCIFPFEEAFYESHGLSARFVGNPLVERLPLQLTKKESREKLGITWAEADPTLRVVTLFVGSRAHEIQMHFDLMVDSVNRVAKKLGGKWIVLLPLATARQKKEIDDQLKKKFEKFASAAEFKTYLDLGAECLVAADVGLIKSGTSTLEAAILGCPHLIVYKTGKSSYWVYQNVVKYRGPIGLPNLIAGAKEGEPFHPELITPIVPEIYGSAVTVSELSDEFERLLTEPGRIEKMKQDFSELREKMSQSSLGAAENVAHEIWQIVRPSP